MLNKGFSKIVLIIIILAILGGGYYLWKDKLGSPTSKLEPDAVDWKTYRNDEYGFEFKYPADVFLAPEEIKVSDPDGNKTHFFLCRLGADDSQHGEKPCLKKTEDGHFLGSLDISIKKDGVYSSYGSGRSFLSTNTKGHYSPVIIGEKEAFRNKNYSSNEVYNIRLANDFFVDIIQLNKYEDGCLKPTGSHGDCGLEKVFDEYTRELFNQILSTFRFTK